MNLEGEGSWNVLTGDPARDRRNVRLLLESVRALWSPRPLARLLEDGVDRALELSGAQRGFLYVMRDGRPTCVVARAAGGIALPVSERTSRSVIEEVARTGRPSTTVATEQGEVSLSASMAFLKLLSVMAVPLMTSQRVLGVLAVDSTIAVRSFETADSQVFQALGGLVGLALETSLLLAERSEKERLQRELEVARRMQERLLPRDVVPPAGWSLAADYEACEGASGDYYDIVDGGDGRLVLVIGDVSGHGPGPAIVMAGVRAVLRSTLAASESPAHTLARLNGLLLRDMRGEGFCSLFLAHLEPATGKLNYANAGHNPPLVRRRSGTLEPLRGTGIVLGVTDGVSWAEGTACRLEPGDALFAYTDGLTESANEQGALWGEAHLTAALAQCAAEQGPEAMLKSIRDRQRAFRGAEPPSDDLAAWILLRNP